jgi:hypothetical protein
MSDYDSGLTKDEQIDELNAHVKARIAPSKIHGVGVFALCDLNTGEKLYASYLPRIFTVPYSNFSKLFPHVRTSILERWPSVINGGTFISPDVRLLTFMNHSEDASYDPETDTMLQNVKAGEEITENYKDMDNWEKVFPWLKEDGED